MAQDEKTGGQQYDYNSPWGDMYFWGKWKKLIFWHAGGARGKVSGVYPLETMNVCIKKTVDKMFQSGPKWSTNHLTDQCWHHWSDVTSTARKTLLCLNQMQEWKQWKSHHSFDSFSQLCMYPDLWLDREIASSHKLLVIAYHCIVCVLYNRFRPHGIAKYTKADVKSFIKNPLSMVTDFCKFQ